MKFVPTPLPGVILIEPDVFEDARGFFLETFRREAFDTAGITAEFVQDNHSGSNRGVLRGLHYQEPHPQGKLVRCIAGAIFDVAVDIRKGSPYFGQWYGATLSAENRLQMWIPPGFAHGFCATSDLAEVSYKCTEVWKREFDRSLLWNDPDLAIEWPVGEPVLSPKDLAAPRLRDAEVLPRYEQPVQR